MKQDQQGHKETDPRSSESQVPVKKPILERILDTADTLPTWLRFIVVFAVLLVIVVLSGQAVQSSLVPLLYLLVAVGFAGYLWVEHRMQKLKDIRDKQDTATRVFTLPQLDEQLWLDTVIKYLGACQSASVYLRYFRDPDYGDDERLSGKQDKIRRIMMLFSRLLLDHKERFILIGFRKISWMDNPKRWLVQQMLQTRPDISEAEARAVVDSHVVVIHDEPAANSSTIYLLDNRYLFYNRVSGEIGNERKTYHAEDLSNSILPVLLKRGLCNFLEGATPESSEYDKEIIDR